MGVPMRLRQDLQAIRFFKSRKVLPLKVLDEGNLHNFGVGEFLDDANYFPVPAIFLFYQGVLRATNACKTLYLHCYYAGFRSANGRLLIGFQGREPMGEELQRKRPCIFG